MAIYITGDVIEVVVNHPVLGSYRFSPKANEAFTLDKGGIRTDDDESSVTGGGQGIYKKNMKRWSIEGPAAVDFLSDNEMGGLNALSASPVEGIITITHISGQIYKATGMPVGEQKTDTNTGTVSMKFAGGGNLEPLVTN